MPDIIPTFNESGSTSTNSAGDIQYQDISNANSGKTGYYSSFWDKVADFLGFGSAGRQAEWQEDENTRMRAFDEYMTKLQNEFNAQEALKERQWQEQMSNTAFTRAVQDLKNAGLNPILATGAQATSGAGASASASNYVANALGANGVASGTGMSGLASLTNSAINLYKEHKANAFNRKMAQSISNNYKSMSEASKQLSNASDLMNIATALLTRGKVK